MLGFKQEFIFEGKFFNNEIFSWRFDIADISEILHRKVSLLNKLRTSSTLNQTSIKWAIKEKLTCQVQIAT